MLKGPTSRIKRPTKGPTDHVSSSRDEAICRQWVPLYIICIYYTCCSLQPATPLYTLQAATPYAWPRLLARPPTMNTNRVVKLQPIGTERVICGCNSLQHLPMLVHLVPNCSAIQVLDVQVDWPSISISSDSSVINERQLQCTVRMLTDYSHSFTPK